MSGTPSREAIVYNAIRRADEDGSLSHDEGWAIARAVVAAYRDSPVVWTDRDRGAVRELIEQAKAKAIRAVLDDLAAAVQLLPNQGRIEGDDVQALIDERRRDR